MVAYWSATGWLTAAVTAGVLYGAAFLLPVPAAVLAAVIARVLLTGALHEDGLSDFLDGFGGGRTREQTLAIMKDSRTGSYGIIGLILYFGCSSRCSLRCRFRWRVRQCFAAIRSASSSRR